jgi:fatty-acyl-CoA synthase
MILLIQKTRFDSTGGREQVSSGSFIRGVEMQKFRISNLADIEDIEKIPIEKRIPFCNTYDLLRYGTNINPDAPAISFISSGEDYLTHSQVCYKDFLYRVTQTANLFHDMGVGPEDVVSCLLPNLIETHLVLWGAQAAGVVNPLNFMLEPSSILNLCRAANTKVLVATGDDVNPDIWRKVMTIYRDLPSLKGVIRIKGPSDEKNGIYGYEDVIRKYGGNALDSRRAIDPQDTSSMLYTGGTTGAPKLAARTHFNEACMPFIANLCGMLNSGDTLLGGTPLFHALAHVASGTIAFAVGAHVLLLSPNGFRDTSIVRNIYRIIERYRAVGVFLVPTTLLMLIDTPIDGADISSLRWVNCGGSPLSAEIVNRWESKTNIKIVQCYGLTESIAFASQDPVHGERRIGSAGLRMPYVQEKILILDEKGNFIRDAQPDEIGSVCVKGPNIFKGYMDPDQNRKAWPQDKWLNTGDLGKQDSEGYFWLTGRSKELIRRGGHNIDPAIIEGPLYKLDGVLMGAAVAKPDPYAGEVVSVYVQLRENSNLTKEEILAYLKEHVGERAAIPKDIVIIENMPVTPVGKIFKPALHWDAVKRAYESELQVIRNLVEFLKVDVGEDKVHGSLASISLKPLQGVSLEDLETRIKEILLPYSVAFRIVVA